MDILYYTFKAFPFSEIFEKYPVFKFHKLKKDIVSFLEIINTEKPKRIIGIAKSSNNNSHFESKTINVFNGTKSINQKGKNCYSLNFPENGYKNIGVNRSGTDSFCNWTMYRIAEHIDGKNIPLQFIHISSKHIKDLEEYLNSVKR